MENVFEHKTEIIEQTAEYIIFKLYYANRTTDVSLMTMNKLIPGITDKVNNTFTVNISDIKQYFDPNLPLVCVITYFGMYKDAYTPLQIEI